MACPGCVALSPAMCGTSDPKVRGQPDQPRVFDRPGPDLPAPAAVETMGVRCVPFLFAHCQERPPPVCHCKSRLGFTAGHTHFNSDRMLHGTRLVSNQVCKHLLDKQRPRTSRFRPAASSSSNSLRCAASSTAITTSSLRAGRRISSSTLLRAMRSSVVQIGSACRHVSIALRALACAHLVA